MPRDVSSLQDLSAVKEILGHTPEAQANLQNVVKRPQQMIFAPIDAAQRGKPAYDIAKSILDAAAGNTAVSGGDIAGNIQDTFGVENPAALAGLATAGAAADVFVDPAASVLAKAAKAGAIPMAGKVQQYGKNIAEHGVGSVGGVVAKPKINMSELAGRKTGVLKTDALASARDKIAKARLEGSKLSTAPGVSGAHGSAVQDILRTGKDLLIKAK